MKMKKRVKKNKTKREVFDFNKELRASWNYIRESKNFISIILGVFVSFFLFGFFVAPPDYLVNEIMKFIQEILSMTEGMNSAELMSFIFFNNLRSSFFGVVFGVLFGIFPVFSAIMNGYLLGFVSSISVEQAGILSLWRIFPHGVFELPAVFISLGMGLRLGVFLFSKRERGDFKMNFFNAMRAFLLIVVPLLVIAAVIEGVLIALAS